MSETKMMEYWHQIADERAKGLIEVMAERDRLAEENERLNRSLSDHLASESSETMRADRMRQERDEALARWAEVDKLFLWRRWLIRNKMGEGYDGLGQQDEEDPVDQSFLDLAVKQRDAAWLEIDDAKREADRRVAEAEAKLVESQRGNCLLRNRLNEAWRERDDAAEAMRVRCREIAEAEINPGDDLDRHPYNAAAQIRDKIDALKPGPAPRTWDDAVRACREKVAAHLHDCQDCAECFEASGYLREIDALKPRGDAPPPDVIGPTKHDCCSASRLHLCGCECHNKPEPDAGAVVDYLPKYACIEPGCKFYGGARLEIEHRHDTGHATKCVDSGGSPEWKAAQGAGVEGAHPGQATECCHGMIECPACNPQTRHGGES